MLSLGKMHIVFIVPAWYRVNHFIALIYNSPVSGINQWAASIGNKYFRRTVIQAFIAFNKIAYRNSKIELAICSRISSVPLFISSNNFILECFRNGKLRRIKIANGIIINMIALAYFFFNNTAQLYNLTSN